MKAILMPSHPKWVAKILNGEKTVDVRKTAPKCELPVEVYVYCTKGSPTLMTCMPEDDYVLNGKIVAKFTLRKIEKPERCAGMYIPETISHTDSMRVRFSTGKESCLSIDEIWEYAKGNGYAWHISDLEIFDVPKELSEFGLKKAPQNWCYVEAKE